MSCKHFYYPTKINLLRIILEHLRSFRTPAFSQFTIKLIPLLFFMKQHKPITLIFIIYYTLDTYTLISLQNV